VTHYPAPQIQIFDFWRFITSFIYLLTYLFVSVDEKKEDGHCVWSRRRQPRLCADNGTCLCTESYLHRHVGL